MRRETKAPALLPWVIAHVRGPYLAHLALTLALAAASLLPPQLFRFFVSALHAPSTAAASLAQQLALYGGAIALALAVLSFANALSRERLQLRIEKALRLAVTRQMLTVPLETFDGLARGELLTRLGTDLAKVESFIAASLPGQLRQLAILLLAAGLFITQCGTLALWPLALVATMAVLGFLAQRKLRPWLDELRTLHAGVFQDMLQSFESIRTLRSHGAGARHLVGFAQNLSRMANRSLRVVAAAGLFDSASTLGYQSMMAACLAFAAWRTASGRMAFDTALTFPFYLGFFYSAAEGLAGAFGEWNRFLVDSRRLAELLPSLTESPDERAKEAGRVRPSWRLQARDLRTGYLGQALHAPLRFAIETGQLWLVTGPSGVGKSTLLEVCAGLRSPIEGDLVCLDAQGETVAGRAASDLCAIVEQRACLWAGTVRSNLTLGAPADFEDADLWDALRDVGLDETITRLGGLDARVEDRGFNFSEGQRYRLALARALLLPRPFLLLDEPFAALDGEAIDTVTRAINRSKRRRGLLIVTHQIPPGLAIDGRLFLGGTKSGTLTKATANAIVAQ